MPAAKSPRNTSKVVGIDHISIRVGDYAKSKAFYARPFEFLGFETSDEYFNTIGWTNGQTRFWIAPAEGRKKYRFGDVGLHHYAFQPRAVFFLDPDGIKLEGMKNGELTEKRKRAKALKKKG